MFGEKIYREVDGIMQFDEGDLGEALEKLRNDVEND